MKPLNKITQEVRKKVLKGAKIYHNTSFPVLRKEDNKFYLAVFVTFYAMEEVHLGTVERPTYWMLLDISTGDVVKEYFTRDVEFSDAPYRRYVITGNVEFAQVFNSYYDEAFDLLETCRDNILHSNTFNESVYNAYLKKILATVPNDYKRFYQDLSNVITD